MTDANSRDKLTLILFFDALPVIDSERHAAAIAEAEPDIKASDVRFSVMTSGENGVLAEVTFAGHAIRLFGIAARLPAASYEAQLQNAHLRPDQKLRLSGHQAHVIASYAGASDQGVEQMIALYKVATALRNDGMRGVFCPATWMMQPAEMLPDLMTRERLAAFRRSPAAMLAIWLGYVKFRKPDGAWWLATKGGRRYGIADLAFLVPDLSEADRVLNLFGDILSYAFQTGKPLGPGHTMQVGEAQLRLDMPHEYAEFLGDDTLVVERVNSPKKRGWLFGRG